MKKRLIALLLTCLMICTCVIPAAAYTPQVHYVNINDSRGISMTPVMTYSEMLDYMVNVAGIPLNRALSVLGAESRSVRTGSYRTLSVDLEVKGKSDFYVPTIDFYCEVSEGDGVWGIVSIYDVEINRSYKKLVKTFAGTAKVWLRGPERIEYAVNGDFYNTGTTTRSDSGGFKIDLGGYGEISYSASSATTSNWYGYCYDHYTKRFT